MVEIAFSLLPGTTSHSNIEKGAVRGYKTAFSFFIAFRPYLFMYMALPRHKTGLLLISPTVKVGRAFSALVSSYFLRRTASRWSAQPRCTSFSEYFSNVKSAQDQTTSASASIKALSSPPPSMPSVERRLISSRVSEKCFWKKCRISSLLV